MNKALGTYKDTPKMTDLCIMGILEGREKRPERQFKEIVAENSPKFHSGQRNAHPDLRNPNDTTQ